MKKIINLLIISLLLIVSKTNATYIPPETLPIEFIFESAIFKPMDGVINADRKEQIQDLKDYIENDIRIYNKLFIPDHQNDIMNTYDIALFEENKNYKVYILLNKTSKERKFIVNSKIDKKDLPVYIYYDHFLKSEDLDLLSVHYYNERFDLKGEIEEIDIKEKNKYIYKILENKKEFIHKGYFDNQVSIEKKTIYFKTGLFIENGVYILKAYDINEKQFLFERYGFDRSDCYFGHSGHKGNERFGIGILTVDLYHPYIYHDKKEGIDLDPLRELYKNSKYKIPFRIEEKLKKVYKNHYRYVNIEVDDYVPHSDGEFNKKGFDVFGFDKFEYNTQPFDLNYDSKEMYSFIKDFYKNVYNAYHYLKPFIKINEEDYEILHIDFKNENNTGLVVSLFLKDKEGKELYLRDIVGNQDIKFDGINFNFNNKKSSIFYKKYKIDELEYNKVLESYFKFIENDFNINFYEKVKFDINYKEKYMLIKALYED
jgi:hypothetical protein